MSDVEPGFWCKVEKNGPLCKRLDSTACWVWLGGLAHGYAKFRGQRAAAVAYELIHGVPVPDGAWFEYRCGRKCCVNVVDHLVLQAGLVVF
jgi:hypothetical protein